MAPAEGLLSSLNALDERLRTFGAPIVEHLQPGLPDDTVRAALAAEGLPTPEELATWWAWHDGTDVPAPTDSPGAYQQSENLLFHTFHLMSLEHSLGSRRWWRRLYDEELAWPEGFPLGWIPLMTSGQITLTYCADALADGLVVPVYIYDHGGGTPYPHRPQFGSLAELIELIVRIFDAGVVTRDPFDERSPFLEYPPSNDDVRRLTSLAG